jgi:hypothetical protein
MEVTCAFRGLWSIRLECYTTVFFKTQHEEEAIRLLNVFLRMVFWRFLVANVQVLNLTLQYEQRV